MMSKVAASEEEVCSMFRELLPDPSVSSSMELNENNNIYPNPSFFNIFGLKWIERAKLMEMHPLSRHPKYPSEQILQCLAYSERDREVKLAKGTSILIGSALGTEQQIAWGVFASARLSCDCRSELASITVDPLIDIIENLIRHYFNIVKYQHRTSAAIQDGNTISGSNLRMIRSGTDVMKGPRWSRQLTTPDPFYGKTSLMGLILSTLHHKMDVEKWQRTMSAQKRLLFPFVCINNRLIAMKGDPDYRDGSIESSEVAVLTVLDDVKSIYNQLLNYYDGPDSGKVAREGFQNLKRRDLECLILEVEDQISVSASKIRNVTIKTVMK